MTQVQEKKVRLALDMYRLRLEQARVDFAAVLSSMKQKLEVAAEHDKLNARNLRREADLLDEISMILVTEKPDPGFDTEMLLSDLFGRKANG